jgi:hypothetical protein
MKRNLNEGAIIPARGFVSHEVLRPIIGNVSPIHGSGQQDSNRVFKRAQSKILEERYKPARDADVENAAKLWHERTKEFENRVQMADRHYFGPSHVESTAERDGSPH